MSEWKVLESKSVLDDKVRILRRRCRGHFYTNYIWFSSSIGRQFPFTKMWICEEGDNMLLLQQYDTFYKLFYYLGDVGNLKLMLPDETRDARVICEFFEEENKEKQAEVLAKLCTLGFSVYRKFYMWECRRGCDKEEAFDSNLSLRGIYDNYYVVGTGMLLTVLHYA